MSKLCSVITTIHPPTPAVRRLCHALRRVASPLLVLGDRKGPTAYPLEGVEFFSLRRQLALPLRLPQLLPVNHYSRKNVGYLTATRSPPARSSTPCPSPRSTPRRSRCSSASTTAPWWAARESL